MSAKPLSILDQAFMLFETEASPKHVGGLFVMQKPDGAPRNYARKLYREMIEQDEAVPPFNLRLSFSPASGMCWREVDELRIKEHVFYHKLSARTTREELLDFVGELHTPQLDRSRPLWECHIINGLSESQFGIYIKIHHSYGDGISFTKLFAQALSSKPSKQKIKAFWQAGDVFRYEKPKADSVAEQTRNLLNMFGKPAKTWLGLNRIWLMLALERFGLTQNAIAVPFTSERTPLNGQVSSGRQIAGTRVSMDRVNRIRKLTRSTLNHVALTCIDGALHRYLDELGDTTKQPLSIQMPVNLRTEDDQLGGNKLGIVLVELSQKTQDPYVRLREIGVTLRNVRYQVDTLPADSIVAYGVVIFTVAQIAEALGISDWLPPLGNTIVSNVPGPKKMLYFKEAKAVEYYPISVLPAGLHLNITLFSYAGQLNFGLVASTDSLPDLHRLAQYIREAFVELEEAILLAPEPPEKKPKRKRKKKAKPRKKTASKK
jgi:WS/DGAT/MGAT family acyltransferase